jgi:uncharacterized membrane protein
MKLSEWARGVALLSHALLIIGLVAWCGWLPGVLLSLPLLAPVPGLLRRSTYTAGWASMLLVFYVAGLLAEGVAVPGRRGVGSLLSVFAALDFVGVAMFVRLTGRERAAASPASPVQKESSDAAAS